MGKWDTPASIRLDKAQGDMSTEEFLKKQDKQLELLNIAREQISNKEFDKAKPILEKIMYEDALIVNGVGWPFLLSKTYLGLEDFDNWWQYTNFLFTEFTEHKAKIREIQATILYKGKKYEDALQAHLVALVFEQENYEGYEIPENTIRKVILKYLKKLKAEDRADYLYDLFKQGITVKPFDEKSFRKAIHTAFAD